MQDRRLVLQKRVDEQRTEINKTVKSAADRLSFMRNVDEEDVVWLAGVVGRLSQQLAEYRLICGRLPELGHLELENNDPATKDIPF